MGHCINGPHQEHENDLFNDNSCARYYVRRYLRGPLRSRAPWHEQATVRIVIGDNIKIIEIWQQQANCSQVMLAINSSNGTLVVIGSMGILVLRVRPDSANSINSTTGINGMNTGQRLATPGGPGDSVVLHAAGAVGRVVGRGSKLELPVWGFRVEYAS